MRKLAITVAKPREDVERLWREAGEERHPHVAKADGRVSFHPAPGERGTEVHVEIDHDPVAGKLGEAAQKLFGSDPIAKVKDDLRHFKQLAETGEIARSDAVPEGEQLERKLKQRPARPLEESELEKAGVR